MIFLISPISEAVSSILKCSIELTSPDGLIDCKGVSKYNNMRMLYVLLSELASKMSRSVQNTKPMPQNEKEMYKEVTSLGILKNGSINKMNPRATLISHMYHSEKAQRSPFRVTM
jgi:hypothetical protein